jgi:energy-coupling factor transport system ATP-binding protein
MNALSLPDEGTVEIFGMSTKDESKLWEIRRRAGMVFQNPDNQLVATVVADDVAFGPENLGIEPSEIRRRVDEALAAVNMEQFASRAPHMLSGGQKQRVAIAGVLALQSDMIILDEPTAMLDPSGRAEVMETVLRLNREKGITVVLITHFMEEAALADRIIVMDNAHTVAEGTPRELFGNTELLIELGLRMPGAVELACALRKGGMPLSADCFADDEVLDEICRSM